MIPIRVRSSLPISVSPIPVGAGGRAHAARRGSAMGMICERALAPASVVERS